MIGQKNYNKYSKTSQEGKMNKIEEKKIKFFVDKLPSFVRAFKTKGKFNRKKRIPKEKALRDYRFIEFNTQVCNFLIVDIDHKKLKLSDIFEILIERNILPTFVTFTNRGYQIGWKLAHPFVTNPAYQTSLDKKLEKYAKYILKKLTFILQGDFAAIRVKGIWRNPVTNKSKIYPSKEYLLDELDIYVKQIDDKGKINDSAIKFHTDGDEIKNKVARILIDRQKIEEVEIGQRNSVLWYIGMFMAKEIRKKIKEERIKKNEIPRALRNIKNELLTLNSMLKQPLKKSEIVSIFKSVKTYFFEDKIFVSFGKYEDWTNEVKRNYIRQYRYKKGIVKFSNSQRKRNNFFRVLYALEELGFLGFYNMEKESDGLMKKAIEKSGLSKTTFYKYYKIILQQKKLFLLNKLLVCLQKMNSKIQENKKAFVITFFEVSKEVLEIFNRIETYLDLFKIGKFGEEYHNNYFLRRLEI